MADTRGVTGGTATLPRDETSPTELLARARAGDEAAWQQLVARYTGLLWAVARGHRLSAADAGDVVQTTWLRLLQHADRIQDAERLASWLGTTVRRECWRLRQRAGRETPSEFDIAEPDEETPEHLAVAADRDARVRAAIASLPDRYRVLLQALTVEPAPSYVEVSELLGLPVGSIGPMRGRALRLLRQHPLLQADALSESA